MKSKQVAEVKQQIEEFREMFSDNPEQHYRDGTWFETLVKMILTSHSKKVNAEYFKKKYVGLDNERIAYKLVDTTSNYVAIAGGIAAGVASAAELSAVFTVGATLAAFGATLLGEISFITYKQMQMIYDISLILDARLEKDDPEDILTIFWFSLGVNVWEDASNLALKAGPRGAEYLGRKALRAGLRKALQKVLAKFGGAKLAQKLTERTLLKMIVPGFNIPIAAAVNKTFTKKLGKKAIKNFKIRSACIRSVDKLKETERIYQILSLALIYHVGIVDEMVDRISKCIEMQNNVSRRVAVREEEEVLIDNLIDLEFEEFCTVLSEIEDARAKENLSQIACYSSLISNSDSDEKLNCIFKELSVDNPELLMKRCQRHIS